MHLTAPSTPTLCAEEEVLEPETTASKCFSMESTTAGSAATTATPSLAMDATSTVESNQGTHVMKVDQIGLTAAGPTVEMASEYDQKLVTTETTQMVMAAMPTVL